MKLVIILVCLMILMINILENNVLVSWIMDPYLILGHLAVKVDFKSHYESVFLATNSHCLEVVVQNTCQYSQWKGDGYCDDGNNNDGCDFDGGDCCDNDREYAHYFCTECECKQ